MRKYQILIMFWMVMLIAMTESVRADVRVFFTNMFINDCKEIGTCDWKLACSLGNQQETEFFNMSEANTNEFLSINRVLTQKEFPPVTITCSVWEHDGGIGAEWETVGTGSVIARTTGNHRMRISNNEGDVVVNMVVEQLGSTGQPLVVQDGIGSPFRLAGPRVAANPQDKWVLTMGDRILVVTTDGRVFAHDLNGAVGQGYQLQSGQRVAANAQDKWVLAMGNRIIVITSDGRVFAHDINGNTVGNAYQMSSPPVAVSPLDKQVLAVGNRILVITSSGGVFAHDVGNSVGQGYQLRSNQKVAANPQDKWTIALSKSNGSGYRIIVITNDGRVFAHDINGNNVGNAYRLEGPRVAANPQDKWVLPMHNRSDRNASFLNSIMVITQDGGTFAHNLSRAID